MTSAQRFGLPAWLRKARELEGINGPPQDSFPRTELANAFRLEALEPRLLLSADPIVGEAARWIEDQTGQDADALAAIVQEINLATQSELTAGLASDATAPAGSAVAWPESWSAAGDASAPNASPNATGAAEAQVQSSGDIESAAVEDAAASAEAGEQSVSESQQLSAYINTLLSEGETGVVEVEGANFYIGEHFNGSDLVLTGTVTLDFIGVTYHGDGSYSGEVAVTATEASLLTGSVDVSVLDSDDDTDSFAVEGTINVGSEDTATLALDKLDIVLEALVTQVESLLPQLLSNDEAGVTLNNVALTFSQFRADDNDNVLSFEVGVNIGNMLGGFGVDFEGNVELQINLDETEALIGHVTSITSLAQLLSVTELADISDAGDPLIEIESANLRAVANILGKFNFEGSVTISFVDMHGADGELQRIGVYSLSAALQDASGLESYLGFDIESDTSEFEVFFAFSDLGPLDFLVTFESDELVDAGGPELQIDTGSMLIKATGFRLVFNNTLEGLQVEGDFDVQSLSYADDALTITFSNEDGSDLEVGDEIRFIGTDNQALADVFTVIEVSEDKKTIQIAMAEDPGLTQADGQLQVIRHNIKDPEDLTDEGLGAAIDLDFWATQLGVAVQNQINNVEKYGWNAPGDFIVALTGDVEFQNAAQEAEVQPGGIDPDKLKGEGELLFDSKGNVLLGGKLIALAASEQTQIELLDGKLYLTGKEEAGVVGIDVLANAALVPDAEIGELKADLELVVDTVTGDVALMVDGTVDINIPGDVASFSVKGASELLLSPDEESDAYNIDFAFAAEVTEGEVGLLGEAEGRFLLTVGDGEFEIYGAADLTVNTDLFSGVGLDFSGATSLTGQIRLNTTGEQQTLDIPARDNELNVIDGGVSKSFDLTAEKIAVIRITGAADLKVGESNLAAIDGVFTFELLENGINAAITGSGENDPTADISLLGDTITGTVTGLLAIRDDGIAGDLAVKAYISIKGGDLALIEAGGDARLTFNTTEDDIQLTDDDGNVVLNVPGNPPRDLDAINYANISQWDWADSGEDSAYGLFIANMEADLLGVVEVDLVANALVTENDGFSLSASFDTEAKFLNLAEARLWGGLTLSNKELDIDLGAVVQLGPDWLNVSGNAAINFTYNFENQTVQGSGLLAASVNVDIGVVDVSFGVDAIIEYDSGTGDLDFGIQYPEPFLNSYVWDTFLGEITIYYPDIRQSTYTFTIGNLKSPEPILGEVADGVLTLNVGELALNREFKEGESNESVTIRAISTNNDGTQTIEVSMLGVTREFENVESISADFGDGNDTLYIAPADPSTETESFEIALTVYFDEGADILLGSGAGSGSSIRAYGGGGDDDLLAGAGADYLDGGAGQDRIEGGAGVDSLLGGSGADTIVWRQSDGADTLIDGGPNSLVNAEVESGDLFVVEAAGGSAIDVTVTKSDSGITIIESGAGQLSPVNVENLQIIGSELQDNVTIADETTSPGETFNINVDLQGESSGTSDQLTVNTSATSAVDDVVVDVDSSKRQGVPDYQINEDGNAIAVDANGNPLPLDDEGNPVVPSVQVDSTTLTINSSLKITVDGDSGMESDIITINTFGGNDTIGLAATAAGTIVQVNSGDDDDTVTVGTGNTQAIAGAVQVDTGADGNGDTLVVSDANSSNGRTGTVTSGQITGLGMAAAGISYANAERLEVTLGQGDDDLFIDSTHAGTTQVNAGGGKDTLAVNTISGTTTLLGQGGDDSFHVNVERVGEDYQRTGNNGLAAELNIDGGDDSDHVTVNLSGQGSAVVNVTDTGGNAGTDTLTINGTEQADEILLRAANVSPTTGEQGTLEATSPPESGSVFMLNGSEENRQAERVNYDVAFNDDNGVEDSVGGLFINTLGGDDRIVADDNSAVTTIDAGAGNDRVQIGQVFGTPRDANAGLADGDEFQSTVTAVIIGVILDPTLDPDDPNAVIFDPTTFDPLEDELTQETLERIQAAVDYQNAQGLPLDGIAYLSNGVSYKTTVKGGADNDSFAVYQNKAELTLKGEDGNDEFIVRAFASVALDGTSRVDQQLTNVEAGAGDDTVRYTANAPVDIDGGLGFDTLLVLGTPFNDNFVVTDTGVYGAGLGVTYEGIESLELDTLEGDDNIFIQSTNAEVVTTVIGGLGNDTFSVAGDITETIAAPGDAEEPASDNFTTPTQDLSAIKGALILEGGAGPEGASRAFNEPLLIPGETNLASAQRGSGRSESEDIDTVTVYHTDNTDADTGTLGYRAEGVAENSGLALNGFGMGEGKSFTVDATQSLTYAGGITFNGFESLDILLGSGDETLAISDTGDASEKAGSETLDAPMITTVHGGGGSDTITVTGRGNGPLVIYGDTSEDGAQYANTGDAASSSGTAFTNAAADTIDASGMADPNDGFVGVVIYGGDGDDQITGSQGDDLIAGGQGADDIDAKGGDDLIYGDSQLNVDTTQFVEDQLNGTTGAVVEVVVGQQGTGDTLHGGGGNDVIFGDHGAVTQTGDTNLMETTGSLTDIRTTSLPEGGADTISGGQGHDILFGGTDGDTVRGDAGSDLIFGDQGSVVANTDQPIDLTQIGKTDGAGVTNPNAQFIYTSDISGTADETAGNDQLYGGSEAVNDPDTGNNIMLGQQGDDTLYGGGGDDDIYGGHNVAGGTDGGDSIDAGAGNDVVLGDNGLIERSSEATDPRFAELTGAQLYDANDNALIADSDAMGANPDGVESRVIELYDHTSGDHEGTFGNDVIAGGADDDLIFGQLGDDTLHGDGLLADDGIETLAATIEGSDVGGDDYIEGNGGGDTIYGGLGQDDIVGGSSSLFNLDGSDLRPDGADTLYGGNNDATDRNNAGDGSASRDADVLIGDNGDIHRIVGDGGYVSYAYDTGDDPIVVRTATLLDYTPGGADSDIGDGDTIRGESGDDEIYGMTGNDILFGDAGNDNLIGGVGNDWISGGTGSDGVLGDDGRIYTSRNGTEETLFGIAATEEQTIDAGRYIETTINETGTLTKGVNLTPFDVGGNDIIYGGLGDDFLHGGAGDDAMSGAEALEQFYDAPAPQDNVLAFNAETEEFAAYNENDPLAKVMVDETGVFTTDGSGQEFLLNFETVDDGQDRLFGGNGNDWLVGGGNSDHLYGGLGSDLLNADDDHTTNGGLNDAPDEDPETGESYADIAVGGGGRDVLIGNTQADRLIDWNGEFNSYVVPFSPFGQDTISRAPRPALIEYLYALSAADGADQTRADDTGSDPARNGEPEGELGLVLQGDDDAKDQKGKPADPQPGNKK